MCEKQYIIYGDRMQYAAGVLEEQRSIPYHFSQNASMLQSPQTPSRDTPLLEEGLHTDPIAQFTEWYEAAEQAVPGMPNAMVLATATPGGLPSARVVLLKSYDKDGFVFFTNYESRKGNELLENPHASLVLYWAPMERQIRIEGIVERVSAAESDRYFQTRPRASQISAAISEQSKEISSRDELEERAAKLAQRLTGADVPRPDNWGGYRVRPHRIEFWQGRAGRLHDRLVYSLVHDTWIISRLQP
jgi:pyridoxamine 5'-phosphate oxidase